MISNRPLQFLAAIISIGSFLTSPATQQAITYISTIRPITNGTASVFRATTFSRSNGTAINIGALFYRQSSHSFLCLYFNGLFQYSYLLIFSLRGTYQPILDPRDQFLIEEAVLSAAYLGPNRTLPIVDPICSTGNCTWPTYGSLGICVEVTNVTDTPSQSLLETFVLEELPNIISNIQDLPPFHPTFIVPFQSPSSLFNESLATTAISAHWIAFSNTPFNVTDNLDVSHFTFFGVAFYFCTKTFSSNVTLGVPSVNELSSSLRIISTPVPSLNWAWSNTCTPSVMGESIILGGSTGLTNETYKVDVCTGFLLSDLFNLIFNGLILQLPDLTVIYQVGQVSYALALSLFGGFLSPNPLDPILQFENVNMMMEDIADSMTNT
jgi:hypothetical protein